MDITSVQHLIDVRNQLDRYASPNKVDWHLACINNRWTKRALASAGFGYPAPQCDAPVFERWKPIFSVAEIGGQDSAATAAEHIANEKELKRKRTQDEEEGHGRDTPERKAITAAQHETASGSSGSDLGQQLGASKAYIKGPTARVAVVHGLNRPLFHIDLTSALQSAVANVLVRERREEGEMARGVGTKET